MQRAKRLSQPPHPMESWGKPLSATLKCNVDCALFNNSSITSYNICFQNSAGQLVFGSLNFELSSSSLVEAQAEVTGLLEAIKFAIDRGMHLVISESDSKIVIDNISLDSTLQNELSDITHRCKDLLATHNGYVVRHVKRQAYLLFIL